MTSLPVSSRSVRLSVLQQRQAHSQKERSRRQELDLLFQNLSQQVAPRESCSKVATLHKV